MEHTTILIVDDDNDFRSMIADSVEQYFHVKQAASGAQALDIMTETRCDIALLDVNMPLMNGYQLCEALLDKYPDTRVLFISGDDTLEARMSAYEAGADDFIAKPFRVAALILKLRRLVEIIANAKALQDSVQQATDVAMLAMSSTGEMGCVLEFTRHLSQSRDLEPLLKSLVSSTASGFGLTVSAQIRVGDIQKTLDNKGRANPLEAEMLRSLSSDSNRIFSMGKRLVLNYPRITLQVKDMPLEDADRCGRLRDHIALLVDAAEQRLDGILMEQRLRQQQQQMQVAVEATRKAIASLEKSYRMQASANMSIFDKIHEDMEGAMVFLGLTEGQERTLMQLIDKGSASATQLYEQGLALDETFAEILSSLESLPQEDTAEPEAPAPKDDGTIILF